MFKICLILDDNVHCMLQKCGESGGSVVREVFGGTVRSTLRCLACRGESQRDEDFTDLPLAFPHPGGASVGPTPSPSKSLVGGGAHLPQPGTPVTVVSITNFLSFSYISCVLPSLGVKIV